MRRRRGVAEGDWGDKGGVAEGAKKKSEGSPKDFSENRYRSPETSGTLRLSGTGPHENMPGLCYAATYAKLAS